MKRQELRDFYNKGFGWICRYCEGQQKKKKKEQQQKQVRASEQTHSRLMREGEAESKQPELSNLALAKWNDETRQTLICPGCGVTEFIDRS